MEEDEVNQPGYWLTAKGKLEKKLNTRHCGDTEAIYEDLKSSSDKNDEELAAAFELKKKYEDILIRERLKKHLGIE